MKLFKVAYFYLKELEIHFKNGNLVDNPGEILEFFQSGKVGTLAKNMHV